MRQPRVDGVDPDAAADVIPGAVTTAVPCPRPAILPRPQRPRLSTGKRRTNPLPHHFDKRLKNTPNMPNTRSRPSNTSRVNAKTRPNTESPLASQ